MAQKKYTVLLHDDTHFLMQHPNGSSFKVAKRNLDPRTADEIKKMADGGEVSDDAVADPEADPSRDIAAVSSDEAESSPYTLGDAVSGAKSLWEKLTTPIPGRLGSDTGEVGGVSHLGERPPAEPTKTEASPFYPTPTGAAPPSPSPSSPSPSAPAPSAPAAKATTGSVDGSGLYDFEKQQLRGVDALAKAQAEQGKQQAAVYDTLAKNLELSDKHYQEKVKQYTDTSERLMNEVYDGKIDPNQYWENKGTGGKVTAAIGIALAGIGGGMSGQGGNVALDVINKAIDRDIDSQKANLNNKSNLLSKNMELTRNLEAATALTKSNLLSIATAQIGKVAGENAGPMAEAMRNQLQGQLKEHFKTINTGLAQGDAQMAFMKGLENDVAAGKQIDPAMYIRYRVPEKDRHKAAEELDKVQKFNDRSENILRLFDDSAKANTVAKTGAGYLRTPPSVSGLVVELEALAKDREGRVNELVLKDMKKMMPRPGDLESTQKEKRDNMIRMLQGGATSSLLDSYKVPYKKAPAEAPQIKTMGGVKYQKVPGGWKKVG